MGVVDLGMVVLFSLCCVLRWRTLNVECDSWVDVAADVNTLEQTYQE